MKPFPFLLLIALVLPLAAEEPHPLVLAHYMPWYASKPVSGAWGWHWTMDHFDPDRIGANGFREAASHDAPLIGLYDSGDPDALECHVQTMRLAGIDGVIIDWYGTKDHLDYAMVHRNTEALIGVIEKAGLKFAICYEDQSIGKLVAGDKVSEEDAVDHAREVFRWMEDAWFSRDSYARVDGTPLLPVFGPQYFEPKEWAEALAGFSERPRVHVLPHLADTHEADGVFGWPPVDGGKAIHPPQWREYLERLYQNDGKNSPPIAVAFPGFRDIYEEAELHDSYGSIAALGSNTFRETLDRAFASGSPVIQIATWNDFGEGTQIEPTRNSDFRFLELVRDRTGANPDGSPGDLRLPSILYRLRKQHDPADWLDSASSHLFAGRIEEARKLLSPHSSILGAREEATPGDISYRTETGIAYKTGETLTEYEAHRCRLDLHHPSDAKGYATVVFFHGGGLMDGARFVPEGLKNRGVAVAVPDYRLSPEVEAPAYIEDAAASVAWIFENIAERGGDPDRIFLSGHSAGGYLAAMLALDPRWLGKHGIETSRLAGAIPLSGQTVTHSTVRKERDIPTTSQLSDDLAPLFHARKEAPPLLLITGDRALELAGRYEENDLLRAAMGGAGHESTTLLELAGYNHGTMVEPSLPLLLDFVETHSPKRD